MRTAPPPTPPIEYRRFCIKVTQNSSPVEPQSLPPTSTAAKFHSLRVFYQMMEWKGGSERTDPNDWGWHVLDGRFMPIMTDQPAPPPEILEVVRCSCKKDCSTKRCTCKKHGLPCTPLTFAENVVVLAAQTHSCLISQMSMTHEGGRTKQRTNQELI